jgi:hypothetical protein
MMSLQKNTQAWRERTSVSAPAGLVLHFHCYEPSLIFSRPSGGKDRIQFGVVVVSAPTRATDV